MECSGSVAAAGAYSSIAELIWASWAWLVWALAAVAGYDDFAEPEDSVATGGDGLVTSAVSDGCDGGAEEASSGDIEAAGAAS